MREGVALSFGVGRPRANVNKVNLQRTEARLRVWPSIGV